MRRLRWFGKLLLAVGVSLCAVVILVVAASQVEQRMYRQRVQLLLTELQSLQLRKTPWEEAQKEIQRWSANRKFDERCDSRRCSVQINLDEFVFRIASERNVFVKLDDYFLWRLNLSYSQGPFVRAEFWLLRRYMRAGGHPARVIANIGMRDGIVWSKGISIWIETWAHPAESAGNEAMEFSLLAEMNSASRFEYYGSPRFDSQLNLHPNYAIGRPGGCEICVMGWVKFTPYAAPEDVYRLMQLDLSCLTRWHPCVTQSDIMPAAWAQYVEERTRGYQSGGVLACSPAILNILGRDSANIVATEVVRYRENFYSNGYDKITATVRVLEMLKGMAGRSVGETHEVTLLSGTICAEERVGGGSRLVLYGGWDYSDEAKFNPKKPWPAISMDDANSSSFRHGIEQDYKARDKTDQR